ncbi:MAG: hypothetical protein IJL39_05170 [Clostridia bacterium]|nr:hypothetical protein [Clostridia bacterium]
MGNRMIKESIRTSKSIGELSDFEFRMWVYLITYVDDYGRGSADPELLKGLVFTRRKSVTEETICKTLSSLAAKGMINLYEVGGESFFCFPTWGDHQRVQQKRSKFPAPPDDFGKSRISTVTHGESRPEPETETKPETEEEGEGETEEEQQESAVAPVPFEKIRLLWNDTCLSLSKAHGINGERRVSLSARWEDHHDFDWWTTYFARIEASAFLTGKNDRGWKATIDWALNAANMDKVLEGKYDALKTGTDASGSSQRGGMTTADKIDVLRTLHDTFSAEEGGGVDDQKRHF